MMKLEAKDINVVLVTDCGSTTTKALLFERKKDRWHQTFRGEAPTTVEQPLSDVTVGALNSFREIQELSGRKILDQNNNFIISNGSDDSGIDLYLSTSSAGGGLQMMVSGIVDRISAESAQRAALGAGAIVLDVLSAEQLIDEHAAIERIRHLRPDIFLMAGGVDGGAKTQLIEMAELLLAASPRPRFGNTLRLPVIYAGNAEAANEVATILGDKAQLKIVENLRPTIEAENIKPARDVIHEFFLEHVMSHSPGYDKLLAMTPVPIVPTPSAVGDIVLSYSQKSHKQILCADIGGATTDVFSTVKDPNGEMIFNRTVSANLGMSYSIANVVLEAKLENIMRWLPVDLDWNSARNSLKNKMIRPTSIPQTMQELFLEQAVCREALALSLQHHKSLAVGLSGAKHARAISNIFSQSLSNELLDMLKIDLVIGSGGVLSHAPKRLSAALMMLDGFNLKGWTEVAVDSIFMMPHLGVLAKVNPEAAAEIFEHDCLVKVCHVLVPVSKGKKSTELLKFELANQKYSLKSDEFRIIELEAGKEYEIKIEPAKNIDIGAGFGNIFQKTFIAGEHGLILDARPRPLANYTDRNLAISEQYKCHQILGLI